MEFLDYVLADVVGVVVALFIYDYIVDEIADRILQYLKRKRRRASVIDRQSIS